MTGSFASAQAARCDPVWPHFPAIKAYQSGAAAEPGKLRAPVSTYTPITKVEDYTEQSFPPVPPLDPSLTSMFGVKSNILSGRRPTPPSGRDQTTARFADRSHQCAFQASAAANNIALLAYSMTKMAAEPELLSERAEELGKAASATLNLCASIAVSTARIAAWQQLIHRNIWLHLSSSIPDSMKKELLEGPIGLEGLFGPHLQSVVDHMQKTSEEAENIKRHVARAQHDARPQRSSGHWRDRRDQRQRQRRPSAAPRPPAPPLPPPLPPQSGFQAQPAARRGFKNRRMTPSWSNPPQEPPMKQSRRQ